MSTSDNTIQFEYIQVYSSIFKYIQIYEYMTIFESGADKITWYADNETRIQIEVQI